LTQLYRDAYIYVMAEDSDTLGEALAALASLAVRRTGRQLSLTATSTLATLERTGPRRLTDLAVNEGVTQPSMTSVVTQLQDLSFAERRRDPADRRVVLVAITSAGRQHLRTMRRAGASVFTALIDKLTGPERAALSTALPALRQLVELAAESPDSQPRSANTQAVRSSRSGRAPGTGPDRRIR
jgi:DNA-binding MarR family transcriptional regulator